MTTDNKTLADGAAQPSPAGQGVALANLAEGWIARADKHDENAREADSIGDMTATVQYLETKSEVLRQVAAELEAALAARQPVGEPVAYTSETQLKAVRLCGDGIMSQRNAKWDIPLYLRPAQAVDLPYSLDADPAGIRALVADAITGTLMVGAQGHTPPPAGHWAEPFWQAALADAALQAKMREALWAAARSLRTIADSTKETEFLETAHEIRAYANSRAICAEQAVIDSKAVG